MSIFPSIMNLVMAHVNPAGMFLHPAADVANSRKNISKSNRNRQTLSRIFSLE